MKKQILGMTKTGIMLGIGSTVSTAAGAPAGVATGFTTMASYMPIQTHVYMGGKIMKGMKKWKK